MRHAYSTFGHRWAGSRLTPVQALQARPTGCRPLFGLEKVKSKIGSCHRPLSKAAVPPAGSIGSMADVPIVVVVEVPLIGEILPRGGPVAVALGSACFFVFVGFGLVL